MHEVELISKDEQDKNETLHNINSLFEDIAYGLSSYLTPECIQKFKEHHKEFGCKVLNISKLLQDT